MFLSDFEFQETQKQTSQNTKRRRKPRPDRSILPLPNSFSPRQRYWRYPISRIVLTRSEVGVTARQDQCGEARAAVVSPLLLYFGEPAPPLATVLQVIIGRGKVPDPRQTAPSWWLLPVRTSKSNVVVKVW